ncbi:MAG: glutamate 5-kinase [Verrucomicrobiota bacterium]
MRKRVVIKFGSGILTEDRGVELDRGQLEALSTAVVEIKHRGTDCILVSSGAVAAGLSALGLTERPTSMPALQASAAVGQSRLMEAYETLFARHGLHVAQLLLTHQDLKTTNRRRNFRNTLEELLSRRHLLPIINENDSVAVEELRYGDNDLLSADVARLAGAEALILLTNVDGLLKDAATSRTEIIERVEEIEEVLSCATDEKGGLSVGGMRSKLDAVKRVVDAGIDAWIANGRDAAQLPDLIEGKGRGTWFLGKADSDRDVV